MEEKTIAGNTVPERAPERAGEGTLAAPDFGASMAPSGEDVGNETDGEGRVLCAAGCNFRLATGDVTLDYRDPDDGLRYRIHAICWPDVDDEDEDEGWFWDSDPTPGVHSEVPVEQLGEADRRRVAESGWAATLLSRALTAGSEGKVKSFVALQQEGLEDARDAFVEIHDAEIKVAREAAKLADALPPDADKAVRDVVAGGRHETLSASGDVACLLCGGTFSSGEPAVVHGRPDGKQAMSHFACAITGENSSGAWPSEDGDDEGPGESNVWPALVGIVTFMDEGARPQANDSEFVAKAGRRALEKLRNVLAARFVAGSRERAAHLLPLFRREVKILRRRAERARKGGK